MFTSASGEVPLGLEREEGEREWDGGADPDGDHDGFSVELRDHRAQHEALGNWKNIKIKNNVFVRVVNELHLTFKRTS